MRRREVALPQLGILLAVLGAGSLYRLTVIDRNSGQRFKWWQDVRMRAAQPAVP